MLHVLINPKGKSRMYDNTVTQSKNNLPATPLSTYSSPLPVCYNIQNLVFFQFNL